MGYNGTEKPYHNKGIHQNKKTTYQMTIIQKRQISKIYK